MKHTALGFALITSLLASSSSFAGVTGGAGNWSGRGASFSHDGREAGRFTIDMVSHAAGKHELVSKITITAQGKAQTFEQRLKDSGNNGFAIESDQGSGGGYCFGKGLCEAYLGTEEHGFAITLVLDGPDSRRMLVTELEKGKVVKFVRESLERVE